MNKILKIFDRNIEVTFDKTCGILKVYDKRVFKQWEQMPISNGWILEKAFQEDNAIELQINGEIEVSVRIELTERSELCFTVSCENEANFEALNYPPAFKTPHKDHYLVLTDSQGLLLPVDDNFYPLETQPLFFCGGGPAMAWIGVTDSKLETGYMAMFLTPFDISLSLKKEEGLITFAPVILSTMGKFGYERKILYSFFSNGGYVAQCKRYREYILPKNNVIPLKDKTVQFPALEKLFGAVHIYVWDKAREADFARELKASGIEKALILWDANHIPYPEPGYDDKLKELGYATGAYELFTDIHPDSFPGNAEIEYIPLKRNVYPGLYEKITSRKKDGTFYSNEFGTYVCPKAVKPEIAKRVEKELAIYPHETYFLDVYQANGIYECYNQEHPLSRKEYAENILENMRMLEENYGVYVGGEFGADFAAAHGVYVHGMMTLQRTWFGSDIVKKGTIYYKGDWEDNPRPSIMIGSSTATGTYLKYSINEYTRVPLYELVYHDAVITSWRWEDGNHHCPEIWWKKDLFNILYGSAPLWSIDQDRWESFKGTFVESYNKVCSWLQQICCDELVDHKFVSDDRKVQVSKFSSGKSVAVNFGDEPCLYEGKTINPRGFITMCSDPNFSISEKEIQAI